MAQQPNFIYAADPSFGDIGYSGALGIPTASNPSLVRQRGRCREAAAEE